ncbi:hypothetical protein BC833DRAFT_612657 [Globomyces pollinis-pini]|nr:hypothetical protein BC833DRAFT_612657 [Globomyces pollinis-pini]
MWFSNTKTFQYKDLPNLEGKVILITGGTSGLGKQSAIELAKKNATVIITARNEEKGKIAVNEILTKINHQNSKVSFGVMDQSHLSSVKSFVKWFLDLNLSLDVLMLNAGIAMVPHQSIDGLESQFYVNHMSHFLLVKLLLEKIKQTPASRVIFVSSEAYKGVKETPDWDILAKKQYGEDFNGSFDQYGVSKLANIQTANALSRRLINHDVYVNTIHPGAVQTHLADKSSFASGFFGGIMLSLIFLGLSSVDSGALTQCYVAGHPDIVEHQYKGCYFIPTALKQTPNDIALDQVSQEKLWEFSEKFVASYL